MQWLTENRAASDMKPRATCLAVISIYVRLISIAIIFSVEYALKVSSKSVF